MIPLSITSARRPEALIRRMFDGVQGAWYDPADPATVFQDAAATTPAGIGDPVGALLDKSGNGNHMTQATADSRPSLLANANSYRYLSFDGSDDTMATANHQTLETGWTIAFAASYTQDGQTTFRGFVTIWNGLTNFFESGARSDANQFGIAITRAASTSGAQVITPNASYPSGDTPSVTVAVLNPTTATWQRNLGTVQSVNLSGTYGPIADCHIGFGTRSNTMTPVAAVQRRMYAALAIKKAVSDAERRVIATWLASKSGVTL